MPGNRRRGRDAGLYFPNTVHPRAAAAAALLFFLAKAPFFLQRCLAGCLSPVLAISVIAFKSRRKVYAIRWLLGPKISLE